MSEVNDRSNELTRLFLAIDGLKLVIPTIALKNMLV
jgi:hypothetical protein